MGFSFRHQTAALLCRVHDIPHWQQKILHVDQVIGLFEADHYPVRKADGGNEEFWNCYHRWKSDHRHKTAAVDIPQMAKRKRIHAKLSRPARTPHSPWPSRKIQSRPFARRRK